MGSRKVCVALAVAALGFAATEARAELIFGLNDSGTNIFQFDSLSPNAIGSGKFLTGLAQNEQIIGIDVRPATGQLYGLGSMGNLYVINPSTGGAVATPAITGATLDGVNFGIDFNPMVDRLRIVSDSGQNLRANPAGGAIVVDTTLFYPLGGATNIVAVGYTNNVPAAPSTTLYGIDSLTDNLVSFVGSPNGGQLVVVGALGLNVSSVAGLDISSSGIAYAVMQPSDGGISNLYTINLGTGAATLAGQIGGGFLVRDIALVNGGGAPIPEPASLGVLALGGLALLARRRRA